MFSQMKKNYSILTPNTWSSQVHFQNDFRVVEEYKTGLIVWGWKPAPSPWRFTDAQFIHELWLNSLIQLYFSTLGYQIKPLIFLSSSPLALLAPYTCMIFIAYFAL